MGADQSGAPRRICATRIMGSGEDLSFAKDLPVLLHKGEWITGATGYPSRPLCTTVLRRLPHSPPS